MILVPAAHQPRCVIANFLTVNPDLCWLPRHQATSSGTCIDLTGHTCDINKLVRLKTTLNRGNWQHQCVIVCLIDTYMIVLIESDDGGKRFQLYSTCTNPFRFMPFLSPPFFAAAAVTSSTCSKHLLTSVAYGIM